MKIFALLFALAFSCQTASATVFDNDNDGIANEGDLCPKTPATLNVDRFGCANDLTL